jgi:hypothetical protein
MTKRALVRPPNPRLTIGDLACWSSHQTSGAWSQFEK